jgi:hypothetical protein
MYESSGYGIHRNISAVLAAAIVAVSGLIWDRAHLASAPEGTVEIGQLAPVEAETRIAALPEIVVIGHRA